MNYLIVAQTTEVTGIMPSPKSEAKPLPSGFKVGEAAALRDIGLVCREGKTDAIELNEVLIHLVEMIGNSNKTHIFDTRESENKRWTTGSNPLDFDNDHSTGTYRQKETHRWYAFAQL
jgi:hypothetical protein